MITTDSENGNDIFYSGRAVKTTLGMSPHDLKLFVAWDLIEVYRQPKKGPAYRVRKEFIDNVSTR